MLGGVGAERSVSEIFMADSDFLRMIGIKQQLSLVNHKMQKSKCLGVSQISPLQKLIILDYYYFYATTEKLLFKRVGEMISILHEKATTLLSKLFQAFLDKKGLYSYISILDAVQHVHIPTMFRKGSRGYRSKEHFVWLFFATMTDRRQVSEEVYKAHVKLHEQYPHLYSPGLRCVNLDELTNILIGYKVGVPRQSAQYWFRCADTLWNKWHGDPRELYGGGSIASALQWKADHKKKFKTDPLPGFGPKIMSLYGLYLAELGEVELSDAFPADVHVQRWFLSNGCIEGLNGKVRNEEMEAVIRPFITKFCNENGISWIDLSHAIWFLGNKVCTGCASKNAALLICPTYESCGGPFDSTSYFREGRWSTAERLRKGGDRSLLLPTDLPLFLIKN